MNKLIRAFSERVVFSDEYDLQNADAKFEDGLLSVIVPKLQLTEAELSKNIEIK